MKSNIDKVYSKLSKKHNLGKQKVNLESAQEIKNSLEKADTSWSVLDDVLNDWVIKYIDLQNEVNSVVNLYDTWVNDRDNLENDDYILLFLDTYDDQRSAFAFAVNPLGQQGDGTITDKTNTSRNSSLTFNLDDNPDYVFTSSGRLTDEGFIVEIEIPFKSLRYKKSDVQNWGFNVLRRVQHSGYRSTLFKVKLDVASFLAQNGKLTNISGIERDKVLEINPEIRSSFQRGPSPEKYKIASNDLLGVNVRYGISSNITLNGTINPDFSQIEADVAQINYDPRRSLFFPEKRPFFLDGIELFTTPTRLIYTRRIANPAAAAKIAGKIGNTSIGFISAADNTGSSLSNLDPAYVNALRLKRDLSSQNHIGFVYTDRLHNNWSIESLL